MLGDVLSLRNRTVGIRTNAGNGNRVKLQQRGASATFLTPYTCKLNSSTSFAGVLVIGIKEVLSLLSDPWSTQMGTLLSRKWTVGWDLSLFSTSFLWCPSHSFIMSIIFTSFDGWSLLLIRVFSVNQKLGMNWNFADNEWLWPRELQHEQ